MSGITTHVLDTSLGRPASGVAVRLERSTGDRWELVGRAATDDDGRVRTLVPSEATVPAGVYRLTFDTAAYFQRTNAQTFYPAVVIIFQVVDGGQHHHVPLLISPFGYSTYRGS